MSSVNKQKWSVFNNGWLETSEKRNDDKKETNALMKHFLEMNQELSIT